MPRMFRASAGGRIHSAVWSMFASLEKRGGDVRREGAPSVVGRDGEDRRA